MSHYLLPEIETARLRLRLFRASDAPAMHRIWRDPDVSRYFSPDSAERTEAQVLHVLMRTYERWRERGYSQWGVALKSAPTDDIIGYCGLQPLADTNNVEVYYGFPREHWGQGLATEAARAALRFAFEIRNMPLVGAVAHPDNTASHRVLEKCGMRFVGKKIFYSVETFYFEIRADEFQNDDSFYNLQFTESNAPPPQ